MTLSRRYFVLIIALVFLYLIRAILPPFIVALVLAYVAVPGIDALSQRLHTRRTWVVLVLYALLILAVGLLFMAAQPTLREDIRLLRQDSIGVIERAIVNLTGAELLDLFGYALSARTLAAAIVERARTLLDSPASAFQYASAVLSRAGELGLTLVVLWYLLTDGERLAASVLRFLPTETREPAERLAVRIDTVLRRYIRGQFLLIGLVALATWAVLQFAFHLPFAILLGILTGFLEVIPLLGPVVAAALAALVAASKGGLQLAVWVVVFYTVLRQAEDLFIAPHVIGRALELHPLVTLFAALAGGVIAGPLGLVLGVPVAATVKILLEGLQEPFPAEVPTPAKSGASPPGSPPGPTGVSSPGPPGESP